MTERLFRDQQIPSFVRPGEFIQYKLDSGDHRLSNEWASVVFDYSGGKSCLLWNVDSSEQGEGRRMIAELVGLVGPGKEIESPITNVSTINTLLTTEEVVSKVLIGGKRIAIRDKKLLSTLKIVRVMEDGGILTDRVIVGKADRDMIESGTLLAVTYYGKT